MGAQNSLVISALGQKNHKIMKLKEVSALSHDPLSCRFMTLCSVADQWLPASDFIPRVMPFVTIS